MAYAAWTTLSGGLAARTIDGGIVMVRKAGFASLAEAITAWEEGERSRMVREVAELGRYVDAALDRVLACLTR
ncbi:hypothetical protein ACIBKY_42305 [Nonomuraea sp. NPDC050394]|uniref:hypothetical protein n=1 Tax=Nonomuraea sp. NPDC050394 TaxID=3364363 RepID=UPI0037B35B28